MKISAFRIRNYRSIVDSKKCLLSPDCITALIGQNESGKTSVLEALRSFYEGIITDDVLRSDLSFPEISCTFILDENKTLADYTDINKLPAELHDFARSAKEISIKRKWLNSKNHVIEIDEEVISEFYKNLENKRISVSDKIISSIPDLVRQADETRLESESSDRANVNTIFAKLHACKAFNDQSAVIRTLIDDIRVNATRLQETEYQYKLSRSEREARNLGKILEQLREKQSMLKNELIKNSHQLGRSRKIAEKLLEGKELNIAEQEATTEYEREKSYAGLDEIGINVFKHIPVFEFFEDFSSLLPNKIDLDDLLNENIHAEGYKAARNFLSIAGLNADFFREENHRILKQKIENLNSEITIDFQDYWRQNVGKDDKIRINFELEHYDNSQPEKSGKPYLEFWVKDKQERLYPKQRSRGVRWFLSFYLEVKATAKESAIGRVMLIDEPGLSLHARAQEDVLKVFEDLRDNLQIIYCTHSPNLIDLNKLYRIIAVQRARESDEKSESVILDARTLNEASADTLSPIYALMGTRLNDKQFIFPKNNFIVEDTVTFHYLEAMSRLYEPAVQIHYIPASGSSHVPVLANIFFGWNVDFGVILSDRKDNEDMIRFLKETTFCNRENGYARKLITVQGMLSVEDLFSTIDFKRFILKQRIGITVRNSEYIEMNKLSRMILVSDFLSKLSSEQVRFKDFDDDTRHNFENLFAFIEQAVCKD